MLCLLHCHQGSVLPHSSVVVSPHHHHSFHIQLRLPSPPPKAAANGVSLRNSIPIRIYDWNINGITPFLPPTTPPFTKFLKISAKSTKPLTSPHSLRACPHRWVFSQVLCLQEVKIARSNTKTIALVHRAFQNPLPFENKNLSNTQLYDTCFCLPKDNYNATGFGGTVYGAAGAISR